MEKCLTCDQLRAENERLKDSNTTLLSAAQQANQEVIERCNENEKLRAEIEWQKEINLNNIVAYGEEAAALKSQLAESASHLSEALRVIEFYANSRVYSFYSRGYGPDCGGCGNSLYGSSIEPLYDEGKDAGEKARAFLAKLKGAK